jgi:hypothetical protein
MDLILKMDLPLKIVSPIRNDRGVTAEERLKVTTTGRGPRSASGLPRPSAPGGTHRSRKGHSPADRLCEHSACLWGRQPSGSGHLQRSQPRLSGVQKIKKSGTI